MIQILFALGFSNKIERNGIESMIVQLQRIIYSYFYNLIYGCYYTKTKIKVRFYQKFCTISTTFKKGYKYEYKRKCWLC